MAIIHNVRGGTVKIGYRTIPGNAKGKKEYIVEYWEEKEKKIEM